ncbi:MAG: hypothetical protein LBL96_04180 [Clostridiales bacterium]|nr:hypothetical protein [Clostridiales bacterium]
MGNAVNEGDRLGIIGFNGTGAVLENYIPQMENNLVFRIEPFEKERLVVEFHINQLWEPARVYGSADPRKLGIALYEVIYKSD